MCTLPHFLISPFVALPCAVFFFFFADLVQVKKKGYSRTDSKWFVLEFRRRKNKQKKKKMKKEMVERVTNCFASFAQFVCTSFLFLTLSAAHSLAPLAFAHL